MNRFALLGRNVAGSFSPRIHGRLSAAFGRQADYDLISAEEAQFPQTVRALAERCDGFNVTMPYKAAILPYLSGMTEEVRLLGACNTVRVEDGRLLGYNTDGDGFLRSLEGFIGLSGKRVLLLGAGGAAAAVAYRVAREGAELSVYNRTPEKAVKLLEKLHIFAKICDSKMCFSQKYDIIINTTSAGMGSQEGVSPLPVEKLQPFEAAIDVVYRPPLTEFLKAAQERGARILNGFGMLFYQALYAERVWLGLPEDRRLEEEVLNACRKEYAQ